MYVANSQFNDGNVTYKPGDIVIDEDSEKLEKWLTVGYIVLMPDASAHAPENEAVKTKSKSKGAAHT